MKLRDEVLGHHLGLLLVSRLRHEDLTLMLRLCLLVVHLMLSCGHHHLLWLRSVVALDWRRRGKMLPLEDHLLLHCNTFVTYSAGRSVKEHSLLVHVLLLLLHLVELLIEVLLDGGLLSLKGNVLNLFLL